MCNLAVLEYKCEHKDSFLVHCPKGNPAQLCEPAEQTHLARYRFDGNCLDCHGRWCTEQENNRRALLNDEIAKIVAKKDDVSALDLRNMQQQARHKAAFSDEAARKKEDEMEGDIRISKEWAMTHAKLIWDMLYHEHPEDNARLGRLESVRLNVLTVVEMGWQKRAGKHYRFYVRAIGISIFNDIPQKQCHQDGSQQNR
ncbi:hypothetical protein MAPG_04390 [Magnaporthiopsis poae ATCC 64411]|uniref:Uncharacterized protein n=1 Tax=Magnaporthiopsis poae (strain ATCC 64411 / 73-15) TaxID=644358 RepID=A0A0C4DWK9_MAGP6|nr:hypothetical protein MAPG_04390 [Magnaporthiopsis poae ATCC 64411]